MPQRLPFQCTLSAALSNSGTGRFINNTQLIASIPAGGEDSVAPMRVTATGPVPPQA